MNHRRWRKALFVLAAGTLLYSGANAQVMLDRSVTGAGATVSSNGEIALVGTLGQAIIGRSASSTGIGQFGFWHTIAPLGTTSVRSTGSQSASGSLRIAPNPIVANAQVRIVTHTTGRVNLRIFDALGRERQIVIDQVRDAGEISLEIDATNLESGSYSAVLNADGAQHTIALRVVR